MLNKLLFRNQDKGQLVIAMIGAFLGITFLVTSIHYLIKVNEFGEGSDILGPNTIIIQRQVTNESLFGLTKTDFGPDGLEEIRKLPFIKMAKPVVSSDLYFKTNDRTLPFTFGTDVFVQTVDKEFLGVKTDKWHWEEGAESVPIILPRQYLIMLNTYASSKKIPQVSEEQAMKIRFQLSLSSKDGSVTEEHLDAYIVGFTSAVPSILVPEEFMTYHTQKFRADEEKNITQLMISSKDGQFGKVEEYMKAHGLESAKSEMDISRLKSIVETLFLVVIGISIIAVFASCLVLIQYMQLLITRNIYEVRTLIRIGYHPKDLIKKFFVYFSIIFAIVIVIGFVSFMMLKVWLDGMFESGGVYIGNSLTLWSFGALAIAYFVFMLSSFLTARKGIYNEY